MLLVGVLVEAVDDEDLRRGRRGTPRDLLFYGVEDVVLSKLLSSDLHGIGLHKVVVSP